jgi:hypothetical protein
MNGKLIEINEKLQILDLYLNKIGSYQSKVYRFIINNFKKNIKNFDNLKSFNYTLLQTPIEALNITYPEEGIDNLEDVSSDIISKKELLSLKVKNKKNTTKKEKNIKLSDDISIDENGENYNVDSVISSLKTVSPMSSISGGTNNDDEEQTEENIEEDEELDSETKEAEEAEEAE